MSQMFNLERQARVEEFRTGSGSDLSGFAS